jgi:hypothetical protein
VFVCISLLLLLGKGSVKCIPPFVARQPLDKDVPAATKNFWRGRPRRRWVDNIKMDLREIGWDGVDWIDMAQDRD